MPAYILNATSLSSEYSGWVGLLWNVYLKNCGYRAITPPLICGCSVHAQSCLTLCDPMDWSCQSPLSMGFPRQEYQSEFSKEDSPGEDSPGESSWPRNQTCVSCLLHWQVDPLPLSPGILMNIEVAQIHPILKIKTNKWNVLISLQTIPNLIVYFPIPLNSKTSGKDWRQEERG